MAALGKEADTIRRHLGLVNSSGPQIGKQDSEKMEHAILNAFIDSPPPVELRIINHPCSMSHKIGEFFKETFL